MHKKEGDHRWFGDWCSFRYVKIPHVHFCYPVNLLSQRYWGYCIFT